MKTLVVVAHPNMKQSRVNKRWVAALKEQTFVTVHELYAEYPDENIDVKREQRLLLDHDRIVLQFPFYWYSAPSLLKKWQDTVLEFGFAYGSNGVFLQGKELMIVTSAGGPAEAYQPSGRNRFRMSELLTPYQAMSNLIGTIFLPPYVEHGVRMLSEEALEASAKACAAHVLMKSAR